jgi:hypothetical protein
MRTGFGNDFELRSPTERVSVADPSLFASKHRISRSPATRLLRIQQSPSDQVQIGERGRDLHAMQALGKTAVADFFGTQTPS